MLVIVLDPWEAFIAQPTSHQEPQFCCDVLGFTFRYSRGCGVGIISSQLFHSDRCRFVNFSTRPLKSANSKMLRNFATAINFGDLVHCLKLCYCQ